MNMLYYQLKIDLIAKYFSEYPESDISPLKAFQEELQKFASNNSAKKDKDKKDVLYIGDNDIDYFTADNAQVDALLVTWGPREIKCLDKAALAKSEDNETKLWCEAAFYAAQTLELLDKDKERLKTSSRTKI